MNSHQRWTEKCDRCNLPCKGTGKEWLDKTRICSFCWQQLVSDLEYAQGKLKEMRLLRVYPIIRERWEFKVEIPMEVKGKVTNPYDMIGDIISGKQEET